MGEWLAMTGLLSYITVTKHSVSKSSWLLYKPITHPYTNMFLQTLIELSVLESYILITVLSMSLSLSLFQDPGNQTYKHHAHFFTQ